jgi:hypothetical protein
LPKRTDRKSPITWEEIQRRILRLDEHALGFSREYTLFLKATTPLEPGERIEYLICLDAIKTANKEARLTLVNAANRHAARPRLPN